ncbi:hypothetical protein THIOM_000435 [Candidatus Thiomargarita nelsonii]|uniref:Uncharacterized protein n=1 Tax=Candidatus Thiomargarita nelsonii TaxID=1003181 RepID=A0A176S6T5_9GAMM|nr:hypothetical protein THIOM_000435 [Candidatus Thiomargarita nelsonii]
MHFAMPDIMATKSLVVPLIWLIFPTRLAPVVLPITDSKHSLPNAQTLAADNLFLNAPALFDITLESFWLANKLLGNLPIYQSDQISAILLK